MKPLPPLTAAQATSTPGWRSDTMWVPSDLCAALERQVAELREEVEGMKGAVQFASDDHARLKDERDEWRLLAEQAADAGTDPVWFRDYERLKKLYSAHAKNHHQPTPNLSQTNS
jgi:hypothetical protein